MYFFEYKLCECKVSSNKFKLHLKQSRIDSVAWSSSPKQFLADGFESFEQNNVVFIQKRIGQWVAGWSNDH